jgi:hypothetical protein
MPMLTVGASDVGANRSIGLAGRLLVSGVDNALVPRSINLAIRSPTAFPAETTPDPPIVSTAGRVDHDVGS